MSDIIQLLPDAVANQIAAGEVVQRPSSVVKEMVENSIDAGSTKITVNIKDAGKTLIQVIDNGCGMSEMDARMCFERHATSKIRKAEDLFGIRTMGFRGEAMASIAAVAEVDLKTKQVEDELGIYICIKGSKLETQEPVSAPNGTSIAVKNLFFNIPARRKFLKANSTELKHIIADFQRMALCHEDVEMSLFHNDAPVYQLMAGNKHQRIVGIFGKSISQNLIRIESETSLVSVTGYIGKPEKARKTHGEQYFFVNGRFMKHPYFHKAIVKAYEGIIMPDVYPSYFIYLDVNPSTIDVNIHPTKTEIKFENEQAIWQILQASARQAIGKHNVAPSIDFDTQGMPEIPVKRNDDEPVGMPEIKVNPNFNPFEQEEESARSFSTQSIPSRGFGGGSGSSGGGASSFSGSGSSSGSFSGGSYGTSPKTSAKHWESLYQGIEEMKQEESEDLNIDFESEEEGHEIKKEEQVNTGAQSLMQFKGRYILSPVKSGLMFIDQRRAHMRILFEKYVQNLETSKHAAQQDLFPQTIDLSADDMEILLQLLDDLACIGFDIKRFGQASVIIQAYPAELNVNDPKAFLEELLEDYKQTKGDVKKSAKERLAQSLAYASAINYGKSLGQEEMQVLVDELFACSVPNYAPNGKTVISIYKMADIDKMF